MPLFILCLLSGDLFLQLFSRLPSGAFVYGITIASVLLWMFLRHRLHYSCILPVFMFGFAWSFYCAHTLLAWELPKHIEGKNVIVTGYIASIPVVDDRQTSFLFSLKKIRADNVLINTNTTIRLAWRDCDQIINVGDKWKFTARLKRIHGLQNPGAFDFEAWALQKGMRSTGYVVDSPQNTFLSSRWMIHPVDRLRQHLQGLILANLPATPTSHWLIALIIGERTGIPPRDWEVLRNTGTNHLMAIAGLHIGIISGFVHALIYWLWRRNSLLMLWIPAQLAGACAALMVAILYSALAGFSIPTQRACIMLAVFIAALLSRRLISAWHAWSVAMLMVLILNPLSVLTESFWLSFCTIALIIYGMGGRLMPSGLWWKWGRVQWVIGFGLIPLTLYFFQSCSLISFAANSIAIPWLGFFILPFCFLSGIFLLISPPVGTFFLLIADKSLSFLWYVLSWFSHLNGAIWQQAIPSHYLLFLSIFSCLILLFPSGFPGRWLGILWMLPLILSQPDRPANGEFTLTLLDVGQGLSVVVQTKNHSLVFDAGPKFGENFDMGESVVLPYLRSTGVKKIDMLVISHGDNDHIGGAKALLKSFPIAVISTSVPDKIQSINTKNCIAGSSWQWDSIQFSFIYPSHETMNLGNDSSCVLRVDNGVHRVLLTGDIEKFSEKYLIKTIPGELFSDVLVAPHHGSKTSGVKEFISAIHPAFVLYAIGYRNRYHFPHQSVVDSYTKINSIQLNTVDAGAITFNFTQDKNISAPLLYRDTHRRYWYQ